jgi:hypothetical protein
MTTGSAPFDADALRERLRELMTAAGIPPKPTHGYAARALDAAERRLGVPLPPALRVLYGLAAKHRALTHMHNRLLSPAELFRVDGLLVFQRECQNVCTHAVREQDLALPDPPVKQRSKTGQHVYDHVDHVSSFSARSICWEAINYHGRRNGPYRSLVSAEQFATIRAAMSVVAEGDREACMHGDGVVAYAFADRDSGGYTLYAGSARTGALTAFLQRFGPFSGPRWRSARM